MNIYPRDVLALQKTGMTKQAFVMMPFDQKHERTHIAIIDACKEIGISCNRADSLYNQKPILTSIVESIGCSQVLIADLTDKNPNVFYEIGIAHASRRVESVILISQRLDDVPFDLRHLPILLYSTDGMPKLKFELKQRIEQSLATTNGLKIIFNLAFGLERNISQTDLFVEYLSKYLPGKIEKIASIIEDNVSADSDFSEVYFALLPEIDRAIETTKNYLQFLAVSLLSTKYAMRQQRDFASQQLIPILETNNLDLQNRSNVITAQFCFNAIGIGFLKAESIDWIINYLSVPKVGNVDVVRSQIEIWLSENKDQSIESVLIRRLTSSEPHMRESCADILGMRKGKGAAAHLSNALIVETNPYAGRSMVKAISRLNASLEHRKIIVEWLISNANLWNSDEPKSPSLPSTVFAAIKSMGADKVELDDLSAQILKFKV